LTIIEIVLFAAVVVKTPKKQRLAENSPFRAPFKWPIPISAGNCTVCPHASLGFHFLGESIIGPNIDGVAKILINGEKHIRAYGTFPTSKYFGWILVNSLFHNYCGVSLQNIPFLNKQSLPAGEAEAGERSAQVSHETILSFVPTNFLWFIFSVTSLGLF